MISVQFPLAIGYPLILVGPSATYEATELARGHGAYEVVRGIDMRRDYVERLLSRNPVTVVVHDAHLASADSIKALCCASDVSVVLCLPPGTPLPEGRRFTNVVTVP